MHKGQYLEWDLEVGYTNVMEGEAFMCKACGKLDS